MSDILARILARKRDEVGERATRTAMEDVRARALDADHTRGFAQAMEARVARGDAAVIAEIKRASPSQGVIRANYDPAEIARGYEAAGATCLSVLTDIDFFQGEDAHLQAAHGACALPVLRKDFIVDPYQVFESRTLGADCILLIAAALGDAELEAFAGQARAIGLDVLLEVHDAPELERALRIPDVMIGVNNRDLRTFEVSLDTTLELRQHVPASQLLIAESGIRTREDIARLRAAGVHAFLIGEAFMRAAEPGAALSALLNENAA